ncbi:MAG TPA: transporter associated domain-containing protein [Promineifilum sp.]|nr:transporter associated domain-containing protein [Promineifilum sp.]
MVSDVNEYLELDLPEEAADTLSGLVFSLLGRPPVEGDEVSLGDVVIHVESMEDLGVGELSLLLPPSDTDTHFTEWDIADHE